MDVVNERRNEKMTVPEICFLTAIPEQRMTDLKCSENIMEEQILSQFKK
jgi:hypothetical protein